jgi:hypothetical protein
VRQRTGYAGSSRQRCSGSSLATDFRPWLAVQRKIEQPVYGVSFSIHHNLEARERAIELFLPR